MIKTIKIYVGSENPVKVEAVKEVIASYAFLQPAEVLGIDVDSEISPQPHSLEETINGARNRARNAYSTLSHSHSHSSSHSNSHSNCVYGFGLESGLMQVPHSKTGFMDICACAIYDGKEYSLGLSCGFEFPTKIMQLIEEQGMDAQRAAYEMGLTRHQHLGTTQGIIGILSKGRMTRKDYTKQAIVTALFTLENRELY